MTSEYSKKVLKALIEMNKLYAPESSVMSIVVDFTLHKYRSTKYHNNHMKAEGIQE